MASTKTPSTWPVLVGVVLGVLLGVLLVRCVGTVAGFRVCRRMTTSLRLCLRPRPKARPRPSLWVAGGSLVFFFLSAALGAGWVFLCLRRPPALGLIEHHSPLCLAATSLTVTSDELTN